jgi:hypothetical protein
MRDIIAKKARVTRSSIAMVMNHKSPKRDGKTDKQNISESFVHQPTISFTNEKTEIESGLPL